MDFWRGRVAFDYEWNSNETEKTVAAKFGASTTGTHKLISRIAAGRSGGCPVLVFGILPDNITPD